MNKKVLRALYSLLLSASLLFATPQEDSLSFNEQGAKAMRAKNLARAEELFRRAVNLDDHNLTAVFNLAGALLINKKSEQSISLLLNYTKKGVNDAGIYYRLGESYFANKQLKEATQAFEHARQLNPRYPEVNARLGTLYSLQKKFPEAEDAFMKEVELNPQDLESLTSLAAVSLANSKPEQATRIARKALQIKAKPEIYITLGSAHERLKNNKEALIAFKRALDLAPGREDVKEKISDLEKNS